jgi:folate-binding Fe-S cluster repair protein YgfZ
MLGLDRLQAISLTKGCYPGQEIVARTHYLGQSKRSLQCLWRDHPEPPATGTPVSLAGQTVGEVVCAVALDTGLSLLQAVASALQDGAGYECGSATAQPVALVAAPVPLP